MKILSNISEGTHENAITKVASVAISQRHLLVTFDQLNSDQIKICSSTDIPFGVVSDEAGIGDIVNVDLLGCAYTIKILAQEKISAGDLITIGDDGKVIPMPTTAGAYTCIGIALSSANAGACAEILTSTPSKYSVDA